MTRSDWKLAVMFLIGMVVSFLVGMYLLGPLFSERQMASEEGVGVEPPSKTEEPPLIAERVPNGIARQDMDTVPSSTTVVVERVPRPITEPPPVESPELQVPEVAVPRVGRESVAPPQPMKVPPRSAPVRPSPSTVEPEPSPMTTPELQPPAPPVPTTPPPPPAAEETKRRYRVRIGVFREEERVARLMETLTAQGYHPFVEEEMVEGQKRYRVYVGALDSRESAERLKQELIGKGFPAMVEERRE